MDKQEDSLFKKPQNDKKESEKREKSFKSNEDSLAKRVSFDLFKGGTE